MPKKGVGLCPKRDDGNNVCCRAYLIYSLSHFSLIAFLNYGFPFISYVKPTLVSYPAMYTKLTAGTGRPVLYSKDTVIVDISLDSGSKVFR